MEFAVACFYRGSSPLNNAQLDHMIALELVPRLVVMPGFIRYSNLTRDDDNRFGSISVYSDSDTAHAAREQIELWATKCIAMENLHIDEIIQGPLAFSFESDGPHAYPGIGQIRLYKSTASLFEINVAILSESDHILRTTPGVMRYSVMKSSDDQIAVFALTDSEESAKRLAAIAGLLRSKPHSELGKIFPEEPETVIGMKVLNTHKI
jgi:hypothetical protein